MVSKVTDWQCLQLVIHYGHVSEITHSHVQRSSKDIKPLVDPPAKSAMTRALIFLFELICIIAIGLSLSCSKIFLLCIAFWNFFAYYFQNYAHSSHYSPNYAHVFTHYNAVILADKCMHVNLLEM